MNDDKEKIFRHVFEIDSCDLLTDKELYSTMRSMNNTYRANFLIHLNNQSYVVLKDLVEDLADRSVYQTAQEMLNANVRLKTKEEYLADTLAFVNLSTLPERMKNTDCIRHEYSNILNIWCVASFTAIERTDGIVTTVDFTVIRFAYDRTKTQELLLMQKEAISLLSDTKLLFVSVIDRENGETRILQTSRSEVQNQVFDFDQSMQKEAAFVRPADRPEFLKNVQLKALKENLAKKDPYSISVLIHFPGQDGYRRLTYHFSVNKAFPDYILAATEDDTERYTRDRITGMKNFDGFKMDCMYTFSGNDPEQYAVLNFNIVNFKAANGIYGFEIGNWFLKKVLLCLQDSEIPFLSICRETADNYFCLCRKTDCNYERIDHLCDMTIYNEDGLSEKIKLHCGICPITDNHETIDDICDKARIARRHADREIGKNIWVSNKTEAENYLNEALILSSVSEAVENGEIVVYYQPIYDAKSKELASAEALVRWQHPQKGLIPPDVFIPAIERTGQIAEVDLYVAHHVQLLQKSLYLAGKPMVPISFNVSRYDFLQEKYMTPVLSGLRETPEITDKLRIEITETGMINIPGSGEKLLHEMKSMGIKTLIDDFGTGYSSLAVFGERMSDIIKLDIAFARSIGIDERMELLIRAAIETAHYMGIQVIAEGVETTAQYEFLKQHDCDYIQGYYFSKPLPEKDFLSLLEKKTNRIELQNIPKEIQPHEENH